MKDGGSMFPIFEAKRCDADYDLTEPGASLRDWFAVYALVGLRLPAVLLKKTAGCIPSRNARLSWRIA